MIKASERPYVIATVSWIHQWEDPGMEALLKSKQYDGPFNMEDIVVEYQHDKG